MKAFGSKARPSHRQLYPTHPTALTAPITHEHRRPNQKQTNKKEKGKKETKTKSVWAWG